MTIGETKWSGLFDRSDILGARAQVSDTVTMTLKYSGKVHNVGTYPVKGYRLSRFELPGLPVGSGVGVYLTFVQRSFGIMNWVCDLKIKWPHYWITRNGSPVCVFPEIPTTHPLTVSIAILSAPGVAKQYQRRVSYKVDSSIAVTPSRLLSISKDHVIRSLRLSPQWLLLRNPSFRLQISKFKNPVLLASSFVNGSEQFGISWSETTPGSYTSFNRSFSGTSTPNFWTLKPVDYPVNPYSLSRMELDLGQGLFFTNIPNSNVYFNKAYDSRTIISNIPALPPFDTAVINKAIRRLVDLSEVDINNIAQDIVQFYQVDRMISSSTMRLVRSLTALRHGNLSEAGVQLWVGSHHPRVDTSRLSPTKTLAENWLELQYGWKPLLTDIQGAMNSYANYISHSTPIRQVRTTARIESKSIWPVNFENQPTVISAPLKPIGFGERQIFNLCKLVLRFKQDDKMKAFYSQTGFTSPVNLAWELLPYSFVIDWFLPIGPYLESFSTFEGMQFIDGSQTLFSVNKDTANVAFDGSLPKSPTYFSRVRARYILKQVSVTRSKLLNFPLQHFPRFKNPVSDIHSLNALALLRTAFAKGS